MAFDALVANPGRLRILTALAASDQDFVQLRGATQLSDGNLSCHARRLQTAGFIAVYKEFREGRPTTSFALTASGRHALELHAQELLSAIGATPRAAIATSRIQSSASLESSADEEWVD